MIIWLTSSYPFRICNFELFYYSHDLYFLFMVGFALHVRDRQFSVVLAGFFLFCIDRCLRFVQSQRHLAIISARMLSNETMQVCIPKYHQHKYHPASVIFLNLPAVSKFQWHPFTVASSSNVDHDHIMLLINCRGDWTRKLRIIIREQNIKSNYGRVVQAAYEGPYGSDLDYLKGYDVLFFIAGGSGISPFVGLLRDLLCRHQLQQSCVPHKAILIWAVKKSEEIPILELISPYSICPDHQDTLNLTIEVYVTEEERDMYIDTENNKQATEIAEEVVTANHNLKHIGLNMQNSRFLFNMSSSTLPCLVMLFSMAGYLLIAALIHQMYIYPVDHNSNNVYPRWGTGLLVLIEMGIGIFVFGGMTTIAWLWWHSIGEESCVEDLNSPEARQVNKKRCPLPLHQTNYGSRPQFNELFMKHTEGLVESNVGVFVCGPKTIQRSVALACRSHTSLGLVKRKLVFHYHPLNFEY